VGTEKDSQVKVMLLAFLFFCFVKRAHGFWNESLRNRASKKISRVTSYFLFICKNN